MDLYAFQLGRKSRICLGELKSALGEGCLVKSAANFAIFKVQDQDWQELQDRLGGTIKIVKITKEIPLSKATSAEQEIYPALEQIFKDITDKRDRKITFAINLFGLKNYKNINTKQILNFSKKFLKSLGSGSRFVNKDFKKNPKPSMIYKAKVLSKGVDINLIAEDNKLYIGFTVSLQNIDDYSKRDFEKPHRDGKVGMLPPKLAQIMLNLAGPAQTVLDPFCGTGTILMESMLRGQTATGCDIEQRMIDYSNGNCHWLVKEFQPKSTKFRAFKHDARLLNSHAIPESIDAIVTESYLGPPVSKLPSPEEREVIFRDLANLHLNWLRAASKLLKKGSKVVTCVTAYKQGNYIEKLPKFEEIAEIAGFEIQEEYVYDRPDQIVARNIKILILK